MSYKVQLNTAATQLVINHDEAILDVALKAGFNVAYGCNNGNCGLCSARLLNGEISKIKDSDYVFSAHQKAQHSFLMCCNTAASNLNIEVEIAESGAQIPIQYFRAKLSKVDRITEQLAVVRMRVSRSHRLRFMAGQSVYLKHRDYGSRRLAIASCPCDATELEFHIQCDDNEAARNLCDQYRLGEWFEVAGPYGCFTFSGNLARAVVVIACDTGFAASKSLIEHIVAQESEVPVHLYRSSFKVPFYMENLCFSWRDALDQFSYSTLPSATAAQSHAAVWSRHIAYDYPQLSHSDFYLCLPPEMLSAMKSALVERGASAEHIYPTVMSDINGK